MMQFCEYRDSSIPSSNPVTISTQKAQIRLSKHKTDSLLMFAKNIKIILKNHITLENKPEGMSEILRVILKRSPLTKVGGIWIFSNIQMNWTTQTCLNLLIQNSILGMGVYNPHSISECLYSSPMSTFTPIACQCTPQKAAGDATGTEFLPPTWENPDSQLVVWCDPALAVTDI